MDQHSCRFVCAAVTAALLVQSVACGRDADPNARALTQALTRRVPPETVGPSIARREWRGVRQFYKDRESPLIWTRDSKLTPRFYELLAILEQSSEDALNPDDYDTAWLRQQRERFGGVLLSRRLEGRKAIVELELRSTAAVLRYARDLANGRFDPPREWRTRTDRPDYAAIVRKAVDEGRLQHLPARLRPAHGEYHALLKLRQQYAEIVAAGGWPRLPGTRRVRAGQSDVSVQVLRQRLAASGDLRRSHVNGGRVLDRPVAAALEAFQRRHGLQPTGWLDQPTRSALNVTAVERLRQIDVNLDRWRFAPRDLGDRHVRVNIPDFYLGVIDRGRTVLGMRVIVGERERQTPIFSDEITQVVFNPYWNIPESIANDETLPAMIGDPDYLMRNNIELVRVANGRVEPVDPAEIDWSMPLDEGYRFRQRPGAENALGLVKFMFPNRSSVYLHDTPADGLFSRVARSLSHGCVRVERPVDLAHALLGKHGWNRDRIAAAMHGEAEQWVRLKEPVPVHLMYLTAWADGSGQAHFRADVYGHDRSQANALQRRESRPRRPRA